MENFLRKHILKVGSSAIALLVSAFFLKFYQSKDFDGVAYWGQFGDYIGGILNPIFGLISVVMVSVTLQLQIKSNNKQDFENQFFALLGLYTSVLQSIDRDDRRSGVKKSGRDCFFIFYHDILKIAKGSSITLSDAYVFFFSDRGWEIEHYFRTVYHMFKHVRDGNINGLITENEKKKYYDLIKSQLSQYELVLLWFNTESEHKGNWGALINDNHAVPFEHLNKTLLKNSHLTAQAPINTDQQQSKTHQRRNRQKKSEQDQAGIKPEEKPVAPKN